MQVVITHAGECYYTLYQRLCEQQRGADEQLREADTHTFPLFMKSDDIFFHWPH